LAGVRAVAEINPPAPDLWSAAPIKVPPKAQSQTALVIEVRVLDETVIASDDARR
jgi:hypothetical protein